MTFITTDEQLSRVVRKELKDALNEQKQAANPEKLYTVSEAARLMGRCYNTIRNMIDSGRLTPTTDRKYISQRAIDDYLTAK